MVPALPLLLLAASLSTPLPAVPPEEGPSKGRDVWSIGGGPAFSAEVAHSLPDRQYLIVRGSWTHPFSRSAGLEVEAIPLLLLRDGRDGTAWGPSFSLLGRFYLGRGPGPRLGLDAGGGMVFFDRPVPKGTLRTNFTLQLGLFWERPLGRGRSLVLGCRIHHISNADRADQNPGINAVHPYLAFRFR